jgi:hypothetical protein
MRASWRIVSSPRLTHVIFRIVLLGLEVKEEEIIEGLLHRLVICNRCSVSREGRASLETAKLGQHQVCET